MVHRTVLKPVSNTKALGGIEIKKFFFFLTNHFLSMALYTCGSKGLNDFLVPCYSAFSHIL